MTLPRAPLVPNLTPHRSIKSKTASKFFINFTPHLGNLGNLGPNIKLFIFIFKSK
jgi:hypothetical protein